MIRRLSKKFGDGSVKNRAVRGSALTLASFVGGKLISLVSNIALTRLLVPEMFGLMALVQAFISGLQMFSDIGIRTSIIQNPRGDEPNFLNTAWTLQIIRGVFLWLVTCLLAVPFARLYDEPMLAWLLPVAGLNVLILGFLTTNVATAHRHLLLGATTKIQLSMQLVGAVITVALAYILSSVWALVFGGLASATLQLLCFYKFMPGIRNQLCWDREVVSELVRFGKYIFLGTMAAFIINQGDRAVLGGFVTLSQLGIYAIGLLLGTLPLVLSRSLANKVLLPLYRMKPPAESIENQKKIFRARRLLVASTLALSAPFAFLGVPLVEFLYDPRYNLAGPIVVLFALSMVPQLVFNGYSGALLASGDSRSHFILHLTTALLQLAYLFIGVSSFGLIGAILASGAASFSAYPLRVFLLSKYKANDHLGDIGFLALGLAFNGFACWIYRDELALLIA